MFQFIRQAEQVLHLQYIIDAFWPSRSNTDLGFVGAVSWRWCFRNLSAVRPIGSDSMRPRRRINSFLRDNCSLVMSARWLSVKWWYAVPDQFPWEEEASRAIHGFVLRYCAYRVVSNEKGADTVVRTLPNWVLTECKMRQHFLLLSMGCTLLIVQETRDLVFQTTVKFWSVYLLELYFRSNPAGTCSHRICDVFEWSFTCPNLHPNWRPPLTLLEPHPRCWVKNHLQIELLCPEKRGEVLKGLRQTLPVSYWDVASRSPFRQRRRSCGYHNGRLDHRRT